MVKSRRVLPASIAMLGAPWLLYHFLTALLLLQCCVTSVTSEPKISDVAGEEGAIDELQALLASPAVGDGSPTRRASGALGLTRTLPKMAQEKIEFGVGPSDPRYFDQTPSDLRPNSLHTRSQGSPRPLAGRDPLLFGDRPLPYPNSRILNPGFASQNLRFSDAYDQFLGDLPDQYDDPAFADLLNRFDQPDNERSRAFLARLRNVLRSGNGDAARRMLGVVPNARLAGVRGTSQPEFVHFNHQQQPQNRQLQPHASPGTTPSPEEDANPEYNPNDPSSDGNSKKNESDAAHGATLVAGQPQHLGQSQHSVSASNAVVQSAAADENGFSDVYFTAMVAGCTAAAVCIIIGSGVCWYRLNKKQRAAKDADYPAYGVTGPSRELSPGDRTLAHSAQMYHYQHQKNQMIALDKSGAGGDAAPGGGATSDADSEEEEEGERDYTVYECPGLAPMGEMVVPNPMYPPEDMTPASPPPARDGGSLREDRE